MSDTGEESRNVRSGSRIECTDMERCRRDTSQRRRRRRHRKRGRYHRCRRLSVRAIGDNDNVDASWISRASRTVIIVVIIVDSGDDGGGGGGGGGMVAAVVFAAEAKANSMMRWWRRRGLFLGGVHGARGQELAHILRVMCLFVGLKYRRPREGLAAQRTPERSFASMHATVVLHMMAQLERLTAELALERPVAGMRR